MLLLLLFFLHLGVSAAALALPRDKQEALAAKGWCSLDPADKNIIQNQFSCYSFRGNWSSSAVCMAGGNKCGLCPSCDFDACPACFTFLADNIAHGARTGGGVSMLVAACELAGLALWGVLYFYIRQHPPRDNEDKAPLTPAYYF